MGERLIYPPGWGEEKNQEEELAKELVKGIGRQFADVAIKWGARYAQLEHMAVFRSKLWGIEPPITIVANAKPEEQRVLVRKKDQEGLGFVNLSSPDILMLPLPGGQFVEKTPSGLDKVVRKEAGFIEWDMNLTIQEAVEFLSKIDEEAEKRGLYDPDKKQRKSLPEPVYILMPKLKVEEVFSELGTANPLFSQDPQELLRQFDHPEELVIRHDPYTGEPIAIVHKRDIEYLDKREQIVNEVLLEHNITFAELMAGRATRPDVFEPMWKKIREEVERRAKELFRLESLKRLPPHEDPGAEATREPLIAFFEGRVEDAKRMFEKALEEFPQSSYVAHEYAVILAQTDGLESALPYFIKATDGEPKVFIHFLQAAKCLYQLGKKKEALRYLKKALEFEDLRKQLEKEELTVEEVFEWIKREINKEEDNKT
jgi:tetratricopeptide (TPR) repeat protein